MTVSSYKKVFFGHIRSRQKRGGLQRWNSHGGHGSETANSAFDITNHRDRFAEDSVKSPGRLYGGIYRPRVFVKILVLVGDLGTVLRYIQYEFITPLAEILSQWQEHIERSLSAVETAIIYPACLDALAGDASHVKDVIVLLHEKDI